MIERMGVDIRCDMRLGKDFTLAVAAGRGLRRGIPGRGRALGRGAGHPRRRRRRITDALKFLRHLQPPRLGARGQERGGHRRRQLGHRCRPDRPAAGRRERDRGLSPQPRGHAGLRRGNRRGRVRGGQAAAVDRAGGNRRRRAQRAGREVPADAAGRVRPLRPPPSRRGRRGIRDPGRPGAGGHRPDPGPEEALPTTSPWKPATRTSSQVNPVSGQTSEKWIFSGGDAVTGPSSVVEAVAAGERAAVGIDKYLSGKNHAFWRETQEVDTQFDPDAEPVRIPREKLDLIPVAAAQQLRRSGAALARVGGHPPGQPLPPLRLRQAARPHRSEPAVGEAGSDSYPRALNDQP